jgi:hypothetical protein
MSSLSHLSFLQAPGGGTASASEQGQQFERWRVISAGELIQIVGACERTTDEKLAEVLAQAKATIRSNIRDLSIEQVVSLRDQVAALLNPDDWDGEDEIPKIGSLQTLVRLLIATQFPMGALTLARSGNLVSTWHNDGVTVRAEALSDGGISWARVRRAASGTTTDHRNEDTVAGFKETIQI